MNLIERILAYSAERDHVEPGEIVEAKIDVAMVNDITGPLAVRAFKETGVKRVWDPNKIVIVLDHQVPADSVQAANLHRTMREFSLEQGIPHLYDVGQGICHQIMVERGYVVPGSLIVGADSHTCTYGALGAFATGIGSTEMAAVFVTGKLWFKVPETYKIEVDGDFQEWVTPKDLTLKIVGMIGADGAIYKGIEYSGSTIANMSISGRLTLCNMAVEMGAKTGIIEPDEKVEAYLKNRTDSKIKNLSNDDSSSYEKIFNVDVNDLEPQVALPDSVDNVKPISEVEGLPIDQAFLGSCTNGRLEDIRLAAKLIRNRKAARNVRFIVIPASNEVYLKALNEGLIDILIRAGAYVGGPCCGPCFGGHIGLIAEGEVCISTSNRNFRGRMGSPEGKVYLASPATVAASAITGKITDPREMNV